MEQKKDFPLFKSLLKTHLFLEDLSRKEKNNFILERFKFIKEKNQTFKIQAFTIYEKSFMEVNSNNLMFLIDVILDYFKSNNILILFMQNLTFYTKRENSILLKLSKNEFQNSIQENYVLFKLEKLSLQKINSIKSDLFQILEELTLMNKDYEQMIHFLNQDIFINPYLEEAKKWLIQNFVIMGTGNSSYFGILKKQEIREKIQKEINSISSKKDEQIILYESHLRSSVKRYKPLHILLFYYKNKNHYLIGTFASKGESATRYTIPLLKEKLERISKSLEIVPYGFQYRELFKISQLIPLGILFSRNEYFLKEVFKFIIDNLYAYESQVQIVVDKEYNGVWILIIEIQKYADSKINTDFLEKTNITIESFFKRIYNQFLLSFIFLKSQKKNEEELKIYVNENLRFIVYSWHSSFIKAIKKKYINSITQYKEKRERYLPILPDSLSSYLPPSVAFDELEFLENINESKKFFVRFSSAYHYNKREIVLTLNIYSTYDFILNDIIDAIQSTSLQIESEISFLFSFNNNYKKRLIIIYLANLSSIKGEFLEKISYGIEEIINSKHTIDEYNSLLINSKLNIKEIALIKAIANYLYQIYKNYSRIYIMNFIIQHPHFAERIVDYIHSTHLPVIKQRNLFNRDQLWSELMTFISRLKTISEQTIAGYLLQIVNSIYKTNFYFEYDEICFKVNTKSLSFIKKPAPLFEIFVYSKELEGIHIRNNYIARGGIRLSDRIDDYRIEIYDLMKTQIIKNSIIIPDGAKGGFIIKKKLPVDTKEKKQIIELFYKKYIESLLSVTNNIKIKKFNSDMLVKFDPYLVVAADKGTATFSDLANEIAIKKNFWLKDAFASGGKNGYNHKEIGITAKGAWESVKFHFRKINLDPEKDLFTVIGIGDMSGDVFGNGMLLSKNIKLIAAFNHSHIFIDPDPQPTISYQERLRLFKEGKSWEYYNKNLLSKGGEIYERNAAEIQLSKEAREVFKIHKEEKISGEELIRFILKTPADLLWNGGIGTYVCASDEVFLEDPANDSVRIFAKDMQCKVVAEGGNLGFTMKGRIEAAKKGILINSDFIDNSGGVNMSDYEVNIKILLNSLVEDNIISENQKINIIKEIEPEITDKVLKNNQFNNLAIYLELYENHSQNFYIRNIIENLKKEDFLNDENYEYLKNPETQPQIALLLGILKVYLKEYFYYKKPGISKLVEGYYLRKYFPSLILKKFENKIYNHILKNQIVVSTALNELINTLGIASLSEIFQLQEKDKNDSLINLLNFFYITEISFIEIYNHFKQESLDNLINEMIKFRKFIKDLNLFFKTKYPDLNSKKEFKRIYKLNYEVKKPESLKEFFEIWENSLLFFYLKNDNSIQHFLENINVLRSLWNLINHTKTNSLNEDKFLLYIKEKYFTLLKKISSEKYNPENFSKIQNLIEDYKKELKNPLDLFELIKNIYKILKFKFM